MSRASASIVAAPNQGVEVAQVIYISAPMRTYGTPFYDQRLAAIRATYPAAKIVLAGGLYSDLGEWRRAWSVVARITDRLVFFTDKQGFVGKGVHDEVNYAVDHDIPVELLEPSGQLLPYGKVTLEALNEDPEDWAEYATVIRWPDASP